MSSVLVPRGSPGLAHRDVGVAAQGPLLHVDVGDAQLLDEAAQLGQEDARLFGRGDVRLGHDLHQGRAAPVEVHQRVVGAVDAARSSARVHELAGVLLHVHPGDAHAQRGAVLQSPRRDGRRCPGAGRTARSGRPSADRDRSSSCGGRWSARRRGSRGPARCAWRTRPPSRWSPEARPGWPRQMGHTWVLGGSPKVTSQPQNILVRVLSCTWISRPMTASQARRVAAPGRARAGRGHEVAEAGIAASAFVLMRPPPREAVPGRAPASAPRRARLPASPAPRSGAR